MAAHQATTTVVGNGTFIRGRITGSGDLEVAGRIEGEIACSGDVVIETSGLVAANISARSVRVRGAVKGDLTAEDAIFLEAGARVVGDLKAPRIAIAQGGLVRGHVQTGGVSAARPRTASVAASRTPAVTASISAAKPRVAVSTPAPAVRAEPPKASVARSTTNGERSAPIARGASSSSARVGPPPPVVPVLKKGTKAVAHHKKR